MLFPLLCSLSSAGCPRRRRPSAVATVAPDSDADADALRLRLRPRRRRRRPFDLPLATSAPLSPSFLCGEPLLANPDADEPLLAFWPPALKGTLNVLKSCSKAPSVKRVVLISSMLAVAFTGQPLTVDVAVDENWFSDPEFCRKRNLWYALSKTLAEDAAWKFVKRKGYRYGYNQPKLGDWSSFTANTEHECCSNCKFVKWTLLPPPSPLTPMPTPTPLRLPLATSAFVRVCSDSIIAY